MQYWRGLLSSYSLMAIGGAVATAWMIPRDGIVGYLLALAFGLMVGALYAFAAQFLLCYIYFVEIGADGVGGSTFWGRKRSAAWAMIRSARRYRWLTMGLVHVRFADGSPALWLPTRVRRHEAFLRDLRIAAPAESPLLACFSS